MNLRNGGERIFDVVDLTDGELDSLARVTLLVKFASGYLFSSLFVVDRDLEDTFGIAFNGGHLESVGAYGRCSKKTARAVYSANCARIPCVESASRQPAQGLWDIVGCDDVVRIKERLDLLVDSFFSETLAVLRVAALAIKASPLKFSRR